MKQRLKYFSIFIYPFWGYFVYIFFDSKADFKNVFILFILLMLSMPIAALFSSINLLILSLKNKLNTRNLALRNFIYKLLHTPPHFLLIIYIIASAGYQPSNTEFAVHIAIIWTSILVFITGILGISVIIAFIKKQKRSKTMIIVLVILGLGQFIFIIDVLAALILLIITLIVARKEKRILKEQEEAA